MMGPVRTDRTHPKIVAGNSVCVGGGQGGSSAGVGGREMLMELDQEPPPQEQEFVPHPVL